MGFSKSELNTDHVISKKCTLYAPYRLQLNEIFGCYIEAITHLNSVYYNNS